MLAVQTGNFDFRRYAALTQPLMHPADYTSPIELREAIDAKTLSAWVMVDETQNWLGWCALRWRHDKYHKPAHHIWGIVNYTDAKSSATGLYGLGMRMTKFLMTQAENTPLTASIRPENHASLLIARRLGFQVLGEDETWVHFMHKT